MFLRLNPALKTRPQDENRRQIDRGSTLNPVRNSPRRPVKLPSLYPTVSLNSLNSSPGRQENQENWLHVGSNNPSLRSSASSCVVHEASSDGSVGNVDDVCQSAPQSPAAGGSKVKGTPVVLGATTVLRTSTTALGVGSEFASNTVQSVEQQIEDVECETFVVVANRFGKQYVYRFNKAKSLNLFGPLHPFRRAIILFITNQFFEFFILLTIIVNCIFLAIKNGPEEPEYVFAAIYTLEMIVKIIAKGLCMHEFAYLRDPWNWLDFVVVVLGYVTLVPNVANLSGIRTFRVLRALRTISAVEGLKTMVNALLKSMKMLSDVLILTSFFLCIFALVGMQLFVGSLRNKCVLTVLQQNTTNDFFTYAKNTSVWLINPETNNPVVCGNYSTAGKCPANYTCLADIGTNPNYGYTNFDNFGWALVTAFQLITLDYWENVYNYVLSTMGSWYVFYFVMVIFFGSFYLLNLVLAVVAVSYQQEVLALQDKEQYYSNLKGVASSYSFHGCVVPKLLRNGKSKTKSLASKCKMSFCIPCFGTKNGSKPSEQSNGHASDGESSHASTGGTTRHDTTYIEMRQLNENNNGNSNESRTNVASLGAKSTSFLSVSAGGIQLRLSPNPSGEMISQNPQESSSDTSLGVPKSSFSRKLSAISEQSSHDGSENNRRGNNNLRSKSVSFISRSQAHTDSKHKSHHDGKDDRTRTHRPTRWTRIQKQISRIVLNSVFDTVITGCILVNTLFLSLEYPSMDKDFRGALEIGNKVFTFVFLLEMILKLMVFGPKGYIKSRWNIFDGFIVIISVIDLMAELFITEHDSSLSVLRTFRLLRVFKLAQSWRTMNMLLSTIARSVGQLGNLTLVLGIVIYMFAVVGMQIFEEYYTPKKFDGELPRWNFTDFWHSFMMIFRVLCGEWIEPLYDCMRVSSVWATIFFLTTLIIGNFLVLNLFLALLLNAFARESLEEEAQKKAKQKPSKFAQGVKRLSKVLRLRGAVSKPTKVIPTIRVQDGENAPDGPTSNGEPNATDSCSSFPSPAIISAVAAFQGKRGKINRDTIKRLSIALESATNDTTASTALSLAASSTSLSHQENEDNETKDLPMTEVEECCPWCMKKASCSWITSWKQTRWYRAWRKSRFAVKNFVEHRYFEWAVLMIIMASSFALVFEDINLPTRPKLQQALKILNIFFAVVFSAEFLLKVFGLGLMSYFRNVWNCLDVFIVVISITSVITDSTDSDSSLSSFRSLRTLRALRPLRAISRWEGMKVVVNSLLFAIPGIGNVLLVCMVFWLIFSIMGVQFFGGRFYRCVGINGSLLSPDVVNNKSDCIAKGFRWVNSKINFDTSFNGFMALFQVATFEGWMEVMRDAVDARGVDLQPSEGHNFSAYSYFVVFIIFGSFFTLNLFIGVIIDNFNRLKKQYEDFGALDVFLTPSQIAWFSTLRKAANKKPKKMISRPKGTFMSKLFDVVHSSWFETIIMVLICLNILVMMIQHYGQKEEFKLSLIIINLFFTGVFTLEAILRIIVLRLHYFRQPWNIFDFVIVVLSILGIILEYLKYDLFVTPSLFRVARVFRIGRLLRFYKGARGIRRLLFALIISLPALFNIGALLFLIMFIYAIIGMSSFGYVKRTGALDSVVNFETFGSSMLLLFRLSTSAGWNDVLKPLLIQPPDCDPYYNGIPNGNCGTPWLAVLYFTTFILLTFLIIINMYIAIILENLSQAHQQEEVGITDDDLDMFYFHWERYDPGATQYIPHSALSDFVDGLEPPLRIPQPNKYACINLNIPIKQGDRIHCFDVMQSLVRRVLGDIEEEVQGGSSVAYTLMKSKMEQHFISSFPKRTKTRTESTTLRRIQEVRAASVIQKAFRQYLFNKELQRYRLARSMESIAMAERRRSSVARAMPRVIEVKVESVPNEETV